MWVYVFIREASSFQGLESLLQNDLKNELSGLKKRQIAVSILKMEKKVLLLFLFEKEKKGYKFTGFLKVGLYEFTRESRSTQWRQQ